ncbi:MAG: hypothetical protein JO260_09800 [Acidobacteria bacterium]|nr:hypothetical protein [Acidobacteriota bacterium]
MTARSANSAVIEAEPSLDFDRSRVRTHAGIDAGRLVLAAIVLVVAILYVITLKPGHVFVNDDFAAYILHAKNLVEGRSYSDIRYIPNPDALWLSPTSGYPPVYPMILAPVYRIFGVDLRAFKIATVVCFIGFLVVYAQMTREQVRASGCAALLLLVGFNPVFWGQRDFILSEFPYLLFSFAALLVIERVYARLNRHQIDIRNALLVSGLIYLAYGTRTIGIALVFALVAVDLLKFRRLSSFLVWVIALVGVLIGAQTLLVASPAGYVSAFHFSLHTIAMNTVYYGKTLSYVWANGFSKQVQIVFALLFTAAAAWGFAKSLRRERGVREFYLLGYVAVLLAWNSEIGVRGLLPILPLYLLYGMREWIRLFEAARLPVRLMAVGAVVGLATVSYAGEIRHKRSLPAEPNVADQSATEMFAFVREHTSPDDVVVFPKPRTLALFTERRAAGLSPEQSTEQSLAFLRAMHATVVIDPDWSAVRASGETSALGGKEVFDAGEYHVYRLNRPGGNSFQN